MVKTAIITGSSGGIGSAICETLKQDGWFVIGIDQEVATNTFCDDFLHVDLAVACEIEQETWKHFLNLLDGKINGRRVGLLVNNAARQDCAHLADTTPSSLAETFRVNVFSAIELTKFFINKKFPKKMTIINIGSIHSAATKAGFGSYAASKAALKSITHSMAIEFADRANCCLVEPGAVETPMLREGFNGNASLLRELQFAHPSESICKPDGIAKLIGWIAQIDGDFINGASFNIDGGIRGMLPGP